MVDYTNAQSSASKTSNVKGNNGYGTLGKSLDKYCPSNTPITIPYMEAYRTDELYYKDYESPLNSMSSGNSNDTLDGSDANDVTGSTNSSSSGDLSGVPKTTSSNKNKSSNTGSQTSSALGSKLTKAVQTYFKSNANHKTLVSRYKSAGKNLGKVSNVTKKSRKWLKQGYNDSTVSLAIYTVLKNN